MSLSQRLGTDTEVASLRMEHANQTHNTLPMVAVRDTGVKFNINHQCIVYHNYGAQTLQQVSGHFVEFRSNHQSESTEESYRSIYLCRYVTFVVTSTQDCLYTDRVEVHGNTQTSTQQLLWLVAQCVKFLQFPFRRHNTIFCFLVTPYI